MNKLDFLEKVSPSDYFLLKREISRCHSIYQSLYDLSSLYFSDSVQTAAVNFDKKGNMLNMMINKSFWESLPFEGKKFVILHEISHVIYKHGLRAITLDLDFHTANLAQDIFINHHLHNNYGVNRELFDWKKYCWVETLFPSEEVPNNKNFEYYYNKLINREDPISKELIGSHGKPESNENENDGQNENDSSNENDGLNEDSFSEETPDLQDIFDNNPDIEVDFHNFQKNQGPKDNTKKNNSPKSEDNIVQRSSQINQSEYNLFIKELLPEKKKSHTKHEDSWTTVNRRYMDFFNIHNNLFLPNSIDTKKIPKSQKTIWVFTDTSGSCHSMIPIFINIVRDLNDNPNISSCRAFGFGDDCEEIKIVPKNQADMKVPFQMGNDGGLDCIEEKILSIMAKENIPYPDNVIVLTDGELTFHGKNAVKNPKSWFLLISEPTYLDDHTPPGGKSRLFNPTTFMDNTSQRTNKNKI